MTAVTDLRLANHRLSALRSACHLQGVRLSSSQGQHTIHRLGRSVQVYMHTDRWEMPDCAVTGMDGVQVPRGKERDFVTHVAYRLEALARRRIAA